MSLAHLRRATLLRRRERASKQACETRTRIPPRHWTATLDVSVHAGPATRTHQNPTYRYFNVWLTGDHVGRCEPPATPRHSPARHSLERKRHSTPRHENRVSTRGNSPQIRALAHTPPKQQKPLESRKSAQPAPAAAFADAPSAANARRQRRQRSRRRHCCPGLAIQLQGNSCDKRTVLHQKLAEAALSPRGARAPS